MKSASLMKTGIRKTLSILLLLSSVLYGDVTFLKRLESELMSLTEKLSPQVVAITCYVDLASQEIKSKFAQKITIVVRGSGCIISSDGLILTNQHVIDKAKLIKVTLWTGKECEAKIVGEDARLDLAVIKINVGEKLTPVTFGDVKLLKRGQIVLAIGNPLGLATDGQSAVSFGVISAIGRHVPSMDRRSDRFYGNLIQTTAQISVGSSGSPLYDLDGRVVGINTIISSIKLRGAPLGFAIPISKWTKELIERLKAGEKVEHGFLGIVLTDIPGESGAVIVSVAKNTPAEKAGLKVKDIIIEYDGEKILNVDHLIMLINRTKPGKKVHLKIKRENKTLDIKIKVANRRDYVK